MKNRLVQLFNPSKNREIKKTKQKTCCLNEKKTFISFVFCTCIKKTQDIEDEEKKMLLAKSKKTVI